MNTILNKYIFVTKEQEILRELLLSIETTLTP